MSVMIALRVSSDQINDPLLTSSGQDTTVLGSTSRDRVSFPLHDGHGNTIATLARNGTGYSIANVKRYDVWGKVRSDSSVGSSGQILNPTQKYCGNLGHKYDATSGLTYMRARYYEAETGRFISEDPARSGVNWYTYCKNSPTESIDITGKWDLTEESVAVGESVGLDGGGGSAFNAAGNFFKSKLAEIVGRANVDIFVELVDAEELELGSGQFQYRAGQLFIQLARGAGQNLRVLAHELGEAIFRAAELNGKLAAGWTHAESEAWALDRFAEFGIHL